MRLGQKYVTIKLKILTETEGEANSMSFTYKGLTERQDRHMVTDEEVMRQLQRLQQQNPRIAKITDRPTQSGDEVVLDYAGYCDGKQFAGGTAQNQTLVLGSGMFIPGFEEQLLDKVVEEKVTVNVTFPAQYHSEELAGKEAKFECVIHEIRVKTPYELDDVFAKEIGNCDTFEMMQQKMKESLQAYTDERGEMDLQDRLLRKASETLEFTVSDEMLDGAVEEQLQNMQAQLARQGLNLQMYCQFMNTDEQKLREEARPGALAAIKARATVDEIVRLENLEATKEEIAQALAVICRQNGMTMEQMKEHYDAALEQAVVNSVLTSKVMRLIRDAAVVEE